MGVTHGKGLLMVLRTRSAGRTMNRHGSNRRNVWTRGLWTTNGAQDPPAGAGPT
jgi:hypothetical protein